MEGKKRKKHERMGNDKKRGRIREEKEKVGALRQKKIIQEAHWKERKQSRKKKRDT